MPAGVYGADDRRFHGLFDQWVVGSYSNGYFFRGSSSDTAGIFFPAAGEINSGGSLASMGADSYYYTGSITRGSNNSHQLQVKNGTVNNNFNTGHGNGRTCVACVRHGNTFIDKQKK